VSRINITWKKPKMSLERKTVVPSKQALLEHTVLVRHRLEEQYANLEQQNDTAALGMWLFLATEIMFFGTLFTALGVYHVLYPAAFELASSRLNWQIGTINTFVLLISSLMMALGVYCVRTGRQRELVWFLLATAALGSLFLALKAYEYYDDWQQGMVLGSQFDEGRWLDAGLSRGDVPHVQLFLLLYWIMTGAHAVHMVIGIVAVLVIAAFAHRRLFDAHYYSPVEVTGLYWHFIDIVWIFLLPMLYLLGTHQK
jgi:cytochrome c oxidase subunit 3